jgi:hypothetical protein
MKRFCLLLMLVAVAAHAKYIPDPIVRYKIDARLDANAKTVQGHEVIVWRNHTADSIPDLQFHLYLNAFKNNLSTFMREGGATSRRVRFQHRQDSWGYQQVRLLKVDGADVTGKMEFIQPDDGNPTDQTVLRVLLPKPIEPGQSVNIEIDWTSQLPHVFARTGFHGNFFLVAQWFPKPGVYEAAGERHRKQGGWNCHQFHTTTEFFADYGIFDVSLTVPSNFELAATGTLRSKKDNGDGTTTWNHYQEDVHDFAWTTQPRSQVMKIVRTFKADQMTTPGEIAEWARKTGASPEEVKLQDVQVTLFTQREHASQVERHFRATFAGLKWFGLMYGKYPYDVVTVVDPPYGGLGAGGMEYPTFFTAGTQYWPAAHRQSPEGVTIHEFGHQFWYGLVGNNEFEEAWLDEGFNTYSTGKVLEMEYGPDYAYQGVFGVPVPGLAWVTLPVPRYPWKGVGSIALGQYWEWAPLYQRYGRTRSYWDDAQNDAMERYSWLTLHPSSYRTQAYSKPELTLRTLESLLGEAWPRVIRSYHQRYRFKHPDALDFIDTVNQVSGRDMNWFFNQTVYGTGVLNYAVSFTTGKAPQKGGFFDENGKPAFLKAEKEKKDDKGPFESEVVVRRLGEMEFPVTALVRFADGSEVREIWDGHYRWTKFKYTDKPKIVSAEIDPDFHWNMEVQRTDDSYLAHAVELAPEKWYLRWVVWIQNVLIAFSFFA